jgi:CrcB protein
VRDVLVWGAVALLGGTGSVARFLVSDAVGRRARRRFPTGTLAVNLSGSALLGLLTGLALRGDASLLAGTALLGAYTTFSTWMVESQRLAAAGQRRLLVANVAGSLLLGLAAAALGRALGTAW